MVKSVVLLSGGLDSAVTAAIAMKAGECAFLHVNYGQRTEARELESFHLIADYYGAGKRLVADISYLKDIGGSALTDEKIAVPAADLSNKKIPVTYVPFRNANFLSIAVSWAEVIGAKEVYIGAVEEDSSGYPDCREGFFKAFEKAAGLGTRPGTEVRIITPLIHMRKAEIVKKGLQIKAPLHLTWSCYKDSRAACGKCDSCLLRLRGFMEAGEIDPIPYRSAVK
ncbi:MAG: 7-cyano-7-deazaguanine synthase QueC [Deltaproteobacteria bacterium]|nr:7-cyano-7-deazaguanine synthase QueC [Deltaproteobacteria bacterium]